MDRASCQACTPLLPCIEHEERTLDDVEADVRPAARIDTYRRELERQAPTHIGPRLPPKKRWRR